MSRRRGRAGRGGRNNDWNPHLTGYRLELALYTSVDNKKEGTVKRKLLVVIGLVALAAAPAFCDWRFDLGIDGVFGLSALTDSGSDSTDFGELRFFTLPIGGAAYEWDLGPVNLGVGIRGISLLIINVLWPDVFASLELGPAVIEAHVGGLVFAGFGLVSFFESGEVFIPELSAWFPLGKRKIFHLGAGAVGVYLPDFEDEAVAFIYFVGVKWVLRPSA